LECFNSGFQVQLLEQQKKGAGDQTEISTGTEMFQEQHRANAWNSHWQLEEAAVCSGKPQSQAGNRTEHRTGYHRRLEEKVSLKKVEVPKLGLELISSTFWMAKAAQGARSPPDVHVYDLHQQLVSIPRLSIWRW